ncbi:MAG: hypothetical protein HDQ97_15515 [Lachnospiraceae bacterium]|nr:hypothetical protein [Lachnospiraceae bacterium]
MRKSEKELKTTDAGAPVPFNKDGEKKPRRGRKPKAEKAQEETGAAVEPETVEESSAEQKQETAPETAEMPAAETESPVPESADAEQTAAPSETVQEADTEPQNDTVGEPAAEGENAQKGATEEDNGTEESGEEPEPEQGNTAENVSAPVSVTTASAQIVESPLKQMKKEFQRRSQVIRDEMLNIQNSFVTIGFQLHWIHRNNMFRVLNYKSIYEYAEKECNIKRTTCCNLICIIENYADRDEQGEVIESIADCYRNYSASQLVAMLGMPEDLKEQVSPDMSVRAINRLKKGEPEPGTVVTSPAPSEKPVPVKEPDKEPAVEKAAENPAPEEESVPADAVREEDTETEEMQEAESSETVAEDDTAHEEELEDTGATQMDDDVRELPEELVPNENIGTLAEIDSYTDYQSMQDELDLIMKNVFSADAPVRCKTAH